MTEVLQKIEERLKHYPGSRYKISEDSITVFPVDENGFDVSLFVSEMDSQTLYTVYYDGWHEEFSDEDEAQECFAYGLSSECRLKEFSCGGEPYKWTLEYKTEDGWEEHSTTALIFTKFWRKRTKRYLQNDLLGNRDA